MLLLECVHDRAQEDDLRFNGTLKKYKNFSGWNLINDS